MFLCFSSTCELISKKVPIEAWGSHFIERLVLTSSHAQRNLLSCPWRRRLETWRCRFRARAHGFLCRHLIVSCLVKGLTFKSLQLSISSPERNEHHRIKSHLLWGYAFLLPRYGTCTPYTIVGDTLQGDLKSVTVKEYMGLNQIFNVQGP